MLNRLSVMTIFRGAGDASINAAGYGNLNLEIEASYRGLIEA